MSEALPSTWVREASYWTPTPWNVMLDYGRGYGQWLLVSTTATNWLLTVTDFIQHHCSISCFSYSFAISHFPFPRQ